MVRKKDMLMVSMKGIDDGKDRFDDKITCCEKRLNEK